MTNTEQGAGAPIMSVMLVAHSEYRGVYLGIARRLRADGAAIHLYTATEQESAYYRRVDDEGLFASITVARTLYVVCAQAVEDEKAVVAEARRNEQDLGIVYNELALSDRHLGRGYALGGYRHPRSRTSERTGYVQMLNGFNATIGFWRDEIAIRKPDLIMNPGKVLCVLARRHGIPARILAGSRYKNYYYWAVNEFFENPALARAYEGASPTETRTFDSPYDAHVRFRAKFRKEAGLWPTVKRLGYLMLRHVYWRVRGYDKAKGYYLAENLTYIWRRSRAIARWTRPRLLRADDLRSMPSIYFPLATEPETSLQMLSPEYFYQLSCVAGLSRDLPAGVTLAVKEHYAAVGRRPRDFYGQIGDLKNVRFVDMAQFGLDAVRAADAVATITGTGGFEGAVMGKPVISFGRHNLYNILPHVMVVEDETQLRGYLDAVFAGRVDPERARADGQRFLQAVIDTSFDMGAFSPTHPETITEDEITAANAALLAGMTAESTQAALRRAG